MKPKLLLVFLLLLANLTAKSYALGINVVEVPAPNIEFADANVKAICVANWDTNNDGELSEEEAVAVIDLGTVFKYNTQITSFDELQYFTGLTSIGYQAFYSCYRLTSITIPNSVTSIGHSAFSGCSGLTSVTIGNSVTSIGDYAFYGCSGLTSVTLNNNSIVSNNYNYNTSISHIFGTQVKEYILGENVTSIGDYAFSDCSGLTSVTIPNSVTSIGYEAFQNCSGLTSVTIPNSVTSIGGFAFYGCSGLTSVIIPNSVTSIEGFAFQNCSGLTSVTIPNSVTSIGNYAFYGCSGLTSVTLNNNSIVSNNYNYNTSISHIFGTQVKEYILGENVTSIGDYAFSDCSGLTSVTIPNSVTTNYL